MSARELAGQLKEQIEELQKQGTAAIYCDKLIDYLAQIESSPEPNPSPAEIEQIKAHYTNQIEHRKQVHEVNLELFKSVITSGQNAIKSVFLLNGGAAVALLAFVGHLVEVRPAKVALLASCLLPFAYGVLAVAATSGFTYLSQWFYAKDSASAQKAGFTTNILCIVLGLSSLGCFVWGLFRSYNAMLTF